MTWEKVRVNKNIVDIFVLSPHHIWLVADHGDIYFSNDNLESVYKLGDSPQNVFNLNSICFYDVNRGYAIGDNNTFIRTLDGGLSWFHANGPSAGKNLIELWLPLPNSDIVFIASDDNIIYKSCNNGLDWEAIQHE